jgi:hypothetical protein
MVGEAASVKAEVARARHEYGEALRDLRAIDKQLRASKGAPAHDVLRRHGAAQDRVNRTAARLAALTGRPVVEKE